MITKIVVQISFLSLFNRFFLHWFPYQYAHCLVYTRLPHKLFKIVVQIMCLHLFLHCNTSRELWSKVWNWLGIFMVTPDHLRHHFIKVSTLAGLPRSSHLFLRTIWFAIIWVIWKERNYCIFRNAASSSGALIEKIKLNSFLWLKSKQASFCYSYTDWWKHPLLCMGFQV